MAYVLLCDHGAIKSRTAIWYIASGMSNKKCDSYASCITLCKRRVSVAMQLAVNQQLVYLVNISIVGRRDLPR